MNGNWNPWYIDGKGNGAEKHRKAWKRLHDIVKNVDAKNVKMTWIINQLREDTSIDDRVDRYYPCDDVDVLGMDGFNTGNPWLSPYRIYSKTLKVLVQFNKPILIGSMACAESTESAKAQWIKDFGEMIKYRKNVIGWVWFSEKKEKNWPPDSSSESLQAFKMIIPKPVNQ